MGPKGRAAKPFTNRRDPLFTIVDVRNRIDTAIRRRNGTAAPPRKLGICDLRLFGRTIGHKEFSRCVHCHSSRSGIAELVEVPLARAPLRVWPLPKIRPSDRDNLVLELPDWSAIAAPLKGGCTDGPSARGGPESSSNDCGRLRGRRAGC